MPHRLSILSSTTDEAIAEEGKVAPLTVGGVIDGEDSSQKT